MEEKIDLMKIITKVVKGLQHDCWLLILCSVIGGGVMGLREKYSYTPMYESSATFIVQSNSGQASSSYTDRLAASQMVQIFPYILQSGELSSIVATDLGYTSIPGTISIHSLKSTPIFTVHVKAREPELAYEILESVLENYPKAAEYIIGNTTLILMDETGISENPINSINITNRVIKGAILGFAFAFCIVILFALSRKTVDSKSCLKHVTNLKCFSNIPVVKFKKRKSKELLLMDNPKTGQGFQEAIRTTSIRLVHHMKKKSEELLEEKKVILVTSTLPGEGKSTMSANIAMELAEKKYRVVLIDCDLRNPSISSTMGLEKTDCGFRELLMGDVQLKKVLHSVPNSTLDIILGGKPTSIVSEILSNSRMGKIMNELREKYDYIILDCAPIGMISDAIMFIKLADTGLFVIKQDYAPINRILESIEIMTSRGLDIAGYVINGAEHITGRYGSYYGSYGHYGHYEKYYDSAKYSRGKEN